LHNHSQEELLHCSKKNQDLPKSLIQKHVFSGLEGFFVTCANAACMHATAFGHLEEPGLA